MKLTIEIPDELIDDYKAALGEDIGPGAMRCIRHAVGQHFMQKAIEEKKAEHEARLRTVLEAEKARLEQRFGVG